MLLSGVVGCAGTQDVARSPMPPAVRHPTVVDAAAMQRIDRAAKRLDTEVLWLNPPRRRAGKPG